MARSGATRSAGGAARRRLRAIVLAASLPFAGATTADAQATPLAPGMFDGSYLFAEAGGQVMHYVVYVPVSWRRGKSLPMVVILHGGGTTPEAVFRPPPGVPTDVLQREADKHGFILLAPRGYDGAPFGVPYNFPKGQGVPGVALAGGPTPPRPLTALIPGVTPEEKTRNNRLSETETMTAVRMVTARYGVNSSRVYLMGNSMGGMGTYYLAAHYPGVWCAIGPSDGPVDPSNYPFDRVRYLSGAIIVHGEADTLAPIAGSKDMADGYKAQGVDTSFVTVPNGSHVASWYIALPKIFDFFEHHSCGLTPH